jgi:hypothetical protein
MLPIIEILYTKFLFIIFDNPTIYSASGSPVIHKLEYMIGSYFWQAYLRGTILIKEGIGPEKVELFLWSRSHVAPIMMNVKDIT